MRLAKGLALIAMLAPATASASTTFGHPLDHSPGAGASPAGTRLNVNTIGSSPQYTVPSTGVITAWGTRPGTVGGPARLKLFSGGPATWRVDAESALQTTAVVPADPVNRFPARISAVPGQRIGVYTNGPLGFYIDSPAVADQLVEWTGAAGNPAVGSSTAPTGGPYGFNLANVSATIEADADGDGYGDESQDLCPADGAHGGTACSGSLLGSNLPYLPNSGHGPAGNIFINTALAAGQLTAPVDGVIVRWRKLGASGPATMRLRVVHHVSGATWVPLGTSGTITSAASESILRRADTRLPIAAGDTIGLENVVGSAMSAFGTVPGSSFSVMAATADGTNSTLFAPSANSEMLFAADFEPDADGDRFGDVTQDLCPTDATIQSSCPAPPATGSGAGGGTGAAPGGTGGGPGTGTASFVVTIGGGTIRVSKGSAPISIGCPASAFTSCAGRLRLDSAKAIAARGNRKKVLALGQAGFTIAPGKKTTVSVKLSNKALRALKRAKKLAVKATVSGGTVKTRTIQITLKPAKTKKR